MTKTQLIDEVTAYITNEIVEEDGEVDLETAGAQIGTFVSEFDEEAEDADDPDDDES